MVEPANSIDPLTFPSALDVEQASFRNILLDAEMVGLQKGDIACQRYQFVMKEMVIATAKLAKPQNTYRIKMAVIKIITDRQAVSGGNSEGKQE